MGIEAADTRPLPSQTILGETIWRLRRLMGLNIEPIDPPEEPRADFRGEVLPSGDPRMPYGGRLIHFRGRSLGYDVEHYAGGVFKLNKSLLTGIITNLHANIFENDLAQSKDEIGRKMEPSGTNVMLFRPTASDEFVGFAILRRMRIADHWVLNIVERAIVAEHQRQHLGRFVVSEALRHYREDNNEPIEIIANKTQSAAAVLSIIESGEIARGGLAPFQRKYTQDPELQKVLIEYYINTRSRSSLGLDEDTGRSRREYFDGANAAYTPDQRHRELMAIHHHMEKVLRLNRHEGDAVICLGWARPYMDAALESAA